VLDKGVETVSRSEAVEERGRGQPKENNENNSQDSFKVRATTHECLQGRKSGTSLHRLFTAIKEGGRVI
jgi:hypothetical protein